MSRRFQQVEAFLEKLRRFQQVETFCRGLPQDREHFEALSGYLKLSIHVKRSRDLFKNLDFQ